MDQLLPPSEPQCPPQGNAASENAFLEEPPQKDMNQCLPPPCAPSTQHSTLPWRPCLNYHAITAAVYSTRMHCLAGVILHPGITGRETEAQRGWPIVGPPLLPGHLPPRCSFLCCRLPDQSVVCLSFSARSPVAFWRETQSCSQAWKLLRTGTD